METDLNQLTLTGILERDPITRFADHGTQQVHFTLRVTEPGPAGQAFKLYVPVEAYSQGAEQAGDLGVGHAVLVAGKLGQDVEAGRRGGHAVDRRGAKRHFFDVHTWRQVFGHGSSRVSAAGSPVGTAPPVRETRDRAGSPATARTS